MGIRQGELAQDGGFGYENIGSGGEIPHLQEKVGGVASAAVEEGGGVDPQLEGGKGVVGLANGGGDGVGGLPLQTVYIGAVVGPRQRAALLTQLNARGLSQAEHTAVEIHIGDAQLSAQIVEVAVAGHPQSLGGVDPAVLLDGTGAVVNPAVGLVALVVGVGSRAFQLGGGRDRPLGEGGGHHTGLEGRAGGVETAQGAVKEGEGVVGYDAVVVAVEGGQIVGGIGGDGQKLSVARIHGHDGACLAVLSAVGFLYVADILGQSLLGGDLEVYIDGEVDVLACHGLSLHVLSDDAPVLILHHHLDTVLAVEVLLKGGLTARLAHGGVHGVAQLLVVGPLLGVDGACLSQDVGGVAGEAVDTGGVGGKTNARDAQLLFVGDGLHGDVFGQDVVVGAREAHRLHAPEDADEAVDIGASVQGRAVLPLGVQLVLLHKVGGEPLRRDAGEGIGIVVVVGLRGVHALLALDPQNGLAAQTVGLDHVQEGIVGVGCGIRGHRLVGVVGIVPVKGEIVGAESTHLSAGLQHVERLEHGGIAGGLIGGEDGIVQRQVIGVGVGHQRNAVAVVDLPADGLHHYGALGGAVLLVASDVLGGQLQGRQANDVDRADHQKGDPQPPQAGYGLG